MIVAKQEITDYIPQRAPMIMVDGLLSVDENSAKTCFSIQQHNIFVSENCLSESGLIEHIAQSAALLAGYGLRKAGNAVPVGYIAAVKDLFIYFLPEVNEELTTRIDVVNTVFDFTIIKAEVMCRNLVVAACEMKIYSKG